MENVLISKVCTKSTKCTKNLREVPRKGCSRRDFAHSLGTFGTFGTFYREQLITKYSYTQSKLEGWMQWMQWMHFCDKSPEDAAILGTSRKSASTASSASTLYLACKKPKVEPIPASSGGGSRYPPGDEIFFGGGVFAVLKVENSEVLENHTIYGVHMIMRMKVMVCVKS